MRQDSLMMSFTRAVHAQKLSNERVTTDLADTANFSFVQISNGVHAHEHRTVLSC